MEANAERGFAALALVFVALMAFRAGFYPLGGLGAGDGDWYLRASRLPLISLDFWSIARMPLFPLLIKAFGGSLYELVFVAQTLSAGALVYFLRRGVMASRLPAEIKLVLTIVAFAVALHPVVSFMHHEMMTETLFYAEALFLVGALIGPPSPASGAVFVASAAALCFTRDEGVALAGLMAPAYIVALSGLGRWRALKRAAPAILVLALAGGYLAARQPFNHRPTGDDELHSNQSMIRGVNVALMRVAFDDEMSAAFISAGMPVDDEWQARKGYGFYQAPAGRASFYGCMDTRGTSCAWLVKHATGAYARFMISHPWRLFDAFVPKQSRSTIFDAYVADKTLGFVMSDRALTRIGHYHLYAERMPILEPVIVALGGISEPWALVVMASSLALALIAARRRQARVLPWICGGLLVAATLVYHADTVEVLRHLTTYVLLIRLMTLVIVAGWLSFALDRLRPRAEAAEVSA